MQQQFDQLYSRIDHPIQALAAEKGIEVRVSAHYLDIISGQKMIRIGLKHFIYGPDIVNSFQYYFEAVKPIDFLQYSLVDYSLPKYHEVIGYDRHPVFFPSFSEPLVTTYQYIDFAQLRPGYNVLDLGAYAGLTSIVFKDLVGKLGNVIAVDADEKNVEAIRRNFHLYRNITGNDIDLIYGAVWNHNDGLEFSSEGNMGSSASAIVGFSRGNTVKVKSLTLSAIAAQARLASIDFIKCDVEGAESVVFEDAEFFTRYRPRIIIETHLVEGVESTDKCIADLERYGYQCKRIHQTGVTLPLVECYPPT